MKRSDVDLTTHTGSLPRPDGLAKLMVARAEGKPVDDAAFEREVSEAVDASVRKQVELGVDVIDDGEQSKSGFIAYLNERLGGFTPNLQPRGGRPFDGSREAARVPGILQRRPPPGRSSAQRGLHGPDQLQRRCRAAARFGEPQARDRRSAGRRRLRAVARHRRASRAGSTTSTTRKRTSISTRSPRRCGTSIRRSSRPAFCCSSTTRFSRCTT